VRVLHLLEATGGGTRRHVLDLLPTLQRAGVETELLFSPLRYPAFYAEVVKDLTGLAESSVEGSRKKGFIAPKIGIGKAEASRDPKVIMDALYDNEPVLNQMRAEMGIQRGIELSPEKSFSEAGKEAQKIARQRVLRSQETANIVLLKREEIEEFD
jgi:hypothetical protein